MKSRRLFHLGASAALLGMAACTAIAGLDGDFEPAPDGGGATSGGTSTSSSSSSSGSTSGDLDASTQTDSPVTAADTGAKDVQTTPDVVDSGTDTGPIVVIDPTPPSSTNEATTNCPPVNDPLYFCWDYQSSGDMPPAFTWPESQLDVGATIGADGGPNGDPKRSMIATVSASGLRAYISRTLMVDHPYAVGKFIELSFRFKVDEAETVALIGALRLKSAQKLYGLVVRPDGCGAAGPCVTDTSPSPTRFTKINLNTWYIAKVRVLHQGTSDAATDTWLGSIEVGNKTIASLPNAIDPGDPRPVGLALGIIQSTAPSGNAAVRIDDIRIEEVTPP